MRRRAATADRESRRSGSSPRHRPRSLTSDGGVAAPRDGRVSANASSSPQSTVKHYRGACKPPSLDRRGPGPRGRGHAAVPPMPLWAVEWDPEGTEWGPPPTSEGLPPAHLGGRIRVYQAGSPSEWPGAGEAIRPQYDRRKDEQLPSIFWPPPASPPHVIHVEAGSNTARSALRFWCTEPPPCDGALVGLTSLRRDDSSLNRPIRRRSLRHAPNIGQYFNH